MRLVLFVATFLTLYAGLHLAVWFGVRPLLAGRSAAATLLGLVMVVMTLAPVGVRLLERAGAEQSARLLALVGYLWMGLLFLAFCGFCLIYLVDLVLLLAARLQPPAGAWSLYGRHAALAVLVLAAAAGGYGMVEARRLVVEKVRIESARLPPELEDLRIVQISDLHLGLLNRTAFVRRLLTVLRPLEPDLLVATGDIVDAQIDHLDGLSQALADFRPPLGKYAVVGNHEVYAGLGQATGFIRRAGFELLRNAKAEPVAGLRLVGVDDPAVGTPSAEEALLPSPGEPALVILLKHRPWIEEGSLGRFALQLSGHAHKGQIFPFNYLTAIPYPRQDGLYRLKQGSRLYASRGTGTWGPPMRLFAPPEVTVIDIVRPGTAARH